MKLTLDSYMPKTQFQLPGGSIFAVGTIWDDETVRQLVHIQYTPAGAQEPLVEFAISPASTDALIDALQKRANEARYVSGQRTLDYSPPGSPNKHGASKPTRNRRKPHKKPLAG